MELQHHETGAAGAKAWVVSVMMGLGHMRAAYALRELANGEIVVDGSKTFCSPSEYELWKRMLHTYYFLSRAEAIPFVGKYFLKMLLLLQRIPSYYPLRDLSNPTWSVKYLTGLVKNAGLCDTLVRKTRESNLPLVHTFYATAIAIDTLCPEREDNYLLICDSDINRVWVAENPKKSRIKYLAPGTRVKKRLQLYGVPEERIYLTGFPLPKENIGSLERLEVLKEDLFNRLVRLDPGGHFFNFHERTVEYYLEHKVPVVKRDLPFTLTFTVGGAGAQADMAERILRSLKDRIRQGKIRVVLCAGIRKDVFEGFQRYLESLGLSDMLGTGISIVYDEDVYAYFRKFNANLRTTDVLWTKPSELSFYCALGIPILLSPSVGTHEEINSKWLQDVHAGVEPAGSLDDTGEWLFDLRETGILAEAAWDGFLKGRKLGAYRIEELVRTGKFTCGNSPLER